FWTYYINYTMDLWTSDGTAPGTIFLHRGQRDDYPQRLAVAGGRVFWPSSDSGSSADVELWKSDATVAGTVRVADLYPGPSASAPLWVTAFGSDVLFSALDPDHGRELWRSNGTAAGTTQIELNAGSASPTDLTPVGSRIVFRAQNPVTFQRNLWVTDGTAAGTMKLADDASYLVSDGTTAYFSKSGNRELWR